MRKTIIDAVNFINSYIWINVSPIPSSYHKIFLEHLCPHNYARGGGQKKAKKCFFFKFCSSTWLEIALFWYHFKSVVNVHHHCLWGQGGGRRGGQNSTKVLQHRCSTPKNDFFAVFASIINISAKNYQNIKDLWPFERTFQKLRSGTNRDFLLWFI